MAGSTATFSARESPFFALYIARVTRCACLKKPQRAAARLLVGRQERLPLLLLLLLLLSCQQPLLSISRRQEQQQEQQQPPPSPQAHTRRESLRWKHCVDLVANYSAERKGGNCHFLEDNRAHNNGCFKRLGNKCWATSGMSKRELPERPSPKIQSEAAGQRSIMGFLF